MQLWCLTFVALESIAWLGISGLSSAKQDFSQCDIQKLVGCRFLYVPWGTVGRSAARSDIRKRVRKCSEINITASLLRLGSCCIRYFIASTSRRWPSMKRGSDFLWPALRRLGSGATGIVNTLAITGLLPLLQGYRIKTAISATAALTFRRLAARSILPPLHSAFRQFFFLYCERTILVFESVFSLNASSGSRLLTFMLEYRVRR